MIGIGIVGRKVTIEPSAFSWNRDPAAGLIFTESIGTPAVWVHAAF